MQNETPNWGIEPVPDRLRVLGALDQTMLWGNLGVSLLVLVIGSLLVPALSLRDALIAVVVGSVIGNAMLGVGRDDRRGCARPVDGAPPRAPRPARIVPPDGPEHHAVPRLGDLRADHHRRRGGRALRRDPRLPGAVGVDDLLRRRGRRARAHGPGRLRPAVRAPLRLVGRARLARLPDVVGAVRARRRRALVGQGRGRDVDLARHRSRDRDHGLVGAARRGLHTVLARPSGRPGRLRASATSWARRGSWRSGSSSSRDGASPTRSTCRPRSPQAASQRHLPCSPSRSTRRTRPSPTSTRRPSRRRTSCPGPHSAS